MNYYEIKSFFCVCEFFAFHIRRSISIFGAVCYFILWMNSKMVVANKFKLELGNKSYGGTMRSSRLDPIHVKTYERIHWTKSGEKAMLYDSDVSLISAMDHSWHIHRRFTNISLAGASKTTQEVYIFINNMGHIQLKRIFYITHHSYVALFMIKPCYRVCVLIKFLPRVFNVTANFSDIICDIEISIFFVTKMYRPSQHTFFGHIQNCIRV